jgi:DnaK suppressor protein
MFHMTSTDIDTNAVRERLERRASQLRDEIAQAQSLPSDAAHEVLDLKDQAGDRARDGVAGAEVERDLAELVSIEAALRQLAEGRYGRCSDCDEPIDAQRLLAQPAALRCLRCQTAAERSSA